MAVELQTCSTW